MYYAAEEIRKKENRVVMELRALSDTMVIDAEKAFSEADKLICRFLRDIGCTDAADAFDNVHNMFPREQEDET